MRSYGRSNESCRPVEIIPGFLETCEGSAVVSVGRTKVLCACSVEDKQPRFMTEGAKGWITAEYSLMPASTRPRAQRERSQGKTGGRTHEIQRLIGRSLRQAVDLEALGPRTLWLDCDVVQADGGTRTASITGAWVALALAQRDLLARGVVSKPFITRQIAAVSVGMVKGALLVDLDYSEDSTADVDMNVVMTAQGELIEVQGTAENMPYTRAQLDAMLSGAAAACEDLFLLQRRAISS
jgi:ribonuclease PH